LFNKFDLKTEHFSYIRSFVPKYIGSKLVEDTPEIDGDFAKRRCYKFIVYNKNERVILAIVGMIVPSLNKRAVEKLSKPALFRAFYKLFLK